MKKIRFLVLMLSMALVVCMAGSSLAFAGAEASLKAPTSVKALSSGTSTVKISWGKVSGAEKYQVYRYYNSSESWKRVRTTTGVSASFTGLAKSTTYKFKVCAVSGDTKSAYSSEVSAKTGVVTKISLDRKTKPLYGTGASFTLKATVTAKAPSKDVRWTSSDKNIATVSTSGKVTAKGKGTVKITAKAHNGATASCLVTVGTKFDQTYQKELLRLVNNLRKENGLKPLKYAYSIQAAADLRAQEAWANKDLAHMRYTKKGTKGDFDSVYTDLGLKLSYRGTAENLAWRTNSHSDAKTAAQVYFNQWKDSKAHLANMLHKDAKSMAVSYYYSAGRTFAAASAQLFLM